MTPRFCPSPPHRGSSSDRITAQRRRFSRSRWVVLPGGQISLTALALGLTMLWPGVGQSDVGVMKHTPLEINELSLPVDARGVVLDLAANHEVGWALVRTGAGFVVVRFDPTTMADPVTVHYPFSTALIILQAAIAMDGTAWIIGTETESEPLTQISLLRLHDGKITTGTIRPELGNNPAEQGEDGPMLRVDAILALPDSVWFGGWVGVHSDQVAYAAFWGQVDHNLKWKRGEIIALETIMRQEFNEPVAPYESGTTALFVEKNEVIAVGYARVAEAKKDWVWSFAPTRPKTKAKKIAEAKAGPPSPVVLADPGIGTASVFVPMDPTQHVGRWDWSPLVPNKTSQHREILLPSPLDTPPWPLLAVGFGPGYTNLWIGGDDPAWIRVTNDNQVEHYPASFLKPYRSTRAVVANQEGFWLAMEPATEAIPPLTDVLLRVRLQSH